ncbi:unnamed protein product, partial [Didymodactylos carnosus]
MTIDTQQNLIVTDYVNNIPLRKFLPNGTAVIYPPIQYANVFDVTVDWYDNIYFSSDSLCIVQKLAMPNGSLLTTVAANGTRGKGLNELDSPSVNGIGAVYIIDWGVERIQKWLPNAMAGTTVAGGNGYVLHLNQLGGPSAILVHTENSE